LSFGRGNDGRGRGNDEKKAEITQEAYENDGENESLEFAFILYCGAGQLSDKLIKLPAIWFYVLLRRGGGMDCLSPP
jgi:hypothetical protein